MGEESSESSSNVIEVKNNSSESSEPEETRNGQNLKRMSREAFLKILSPEASPARKCRRLTQHPEPELESPHLTEIGLFSSALLAGGYLVFRCLNLRARRPKGP